MSTPEQMTGIRVLPFHKAVLHILSQEPEGLNPEQIGEAVGISTDTDENRRETEKIVTAALVDLEKQGFVERCMETRWRLRNTDMKGD